MNPRLVQNIETIYENNVKLILKCEYENEVLVAKPFKNDCEFLWNFQNELTTFSIIKVTENEHSNSNLAKLFGYILGSEHQEHPYFGTLFIKWYNLGSLWVFSRNLDSTNLDDCTQAWLLKLSEQIASGIDGEYFNLLFFLLNINKKLLFYKIAMYYLNVELKIIHRDLKAENIFLNEEQNEIKAYVGDFGLAINNKYDSYLKRAFNIGTPGWMVIIKLNRNI